MKHIHSKLNYSRLFIFSLAVLVSIVFIQNMIPAHATSNSNAVSMPSAVPYAYITNYSSGTVSVIDTSTGTVTATVFVGGAPVYAAVHPDNSRVYVTTQGTQNISVIDTATNLVSATIPLGGPNVAGIAINPAGTRAYAIASHYVYGPGSLAVIDTATNTETQARITVGGGPNGVAVSPDGTRVYVTNQYSGTVSVIDTTVSPNMIIDTVTVGLGYGWPVADAIGIDVNPTGTRVYVSNRDSDKLSVIDTTTTPNTVIATVMSVGDGPMGIALDPAATTVYVANVWGNTVSAVDTATNTVAWTVSVGAGPYGLDVDAAGTYVYVGSYYTNSVEVIDTATHAVVQTIRVGSGPFAMGKFISNKNIPLPPSPTTTTVSCPSSVTFIGSALTPCVAEVSGPSGFLHYVPVVYTDNINFGPATAEASFAGDANYTGSGGSAIFLINKADAACTINGYDVPYSSSSHTATGSCVGVLGEPLPGLDLSTTTHTTVGIYSDAWTFTAPNSNYNNSAGTVIDRINANPPANKDQCKNGGWQSLTRTDGTGFMNQGDCIQFVNTGH